MSATSWVAQEMTEPDFGDVRLNKRLITLLEQMAAQPTVSLPQACGSWKDTKAAYRFIGSKKVTPQALRDAHSLQTLRRILPQDRILALTDTTDLELSSKPQMQGLGPINHSEQSGLKVHSVLLASCAGVPLGLIHQEVWARDPAKKGQSKNARQRALTDKESRKWLTALEKTEWAMPQTRPVVLIGDREADMYPLFAAPRRAGTDLLVRAAYDRRVEEEAHTIRQALALAAVAGTQALLLRSREGKPARTVILSVRFTTVTLLPPAYYKGEYPPITVQVIEAYEATPPEGVEPLHWILLTTLAVADFASACDCLDWYGHRWLIEQYHRVLKSGCRIEAMQLQTAARLQVALALYSIVAWRLLWLTFQARQTPDAPCNRILESHEWQALYCTVHRTRTPPAQPPSFREAIHWIARLGGFLGRTGDGEPGVQTLWRGWQRLHDIAETWKLLQTQTTYG